MGGLRAQYDRLVEAGELRPDPEQAAAARRLDALQAELEEEPGLLARFLKPERVRGAYLWGGVGRGKSMLMDLFHDTLAIDEKRRTHFHAFMIEVHQRLREARKAEEGDPIPPVAEAIAENLRCLAIHPLPPVIRNVVPSCVAFGIRAVHVTCTSACVESSIISKVTPSASSFHTRNARRVGETSSGENPCSADCGCTHTRIGSARSRQRVMMLSSSASIARKYVPSIAAAMVDRTESTDIVGSAS